MFPMIATLDELRLARTLFDVVRCAYVTAVLYMLSAHQLGMIVELPAAVVLDDRFAAEMDFFSIGINDLIQYKKAADQLRRTASLVRRIVVHLQHSDRLYKSIEILL